MPTAWTERNKRKKAYTETRGNTFFHGSLLSMQSFLSRIKEYEATKGALQ